MRIDFCYFGDRRNHLVAQCIPRAIYLCPICFTSSHLHSLPLMVKLYHTAAIFKRHMPSNFIRQLAQLLADALSLFLVTMHDGILKRYAAEATLRQRRTRRYLPRQSRACIAGRWSSVRKHPQASSRLIASIVSSFCGIAMVSTPPFLLHQWGQSLSPLLVNISCWQLETWRRALQDCRRD